MPNLPPYKRCDLCGGPLKIINVHEFVAKLADDRIFPPERIARTFRGECPEHGIRLRQSAGEGHSTLLEKKFRKEISEKEAAIIRAKLANGSAQKKLFDAAFRGQYIWEPEEMLAWKALDLYRICAGHLFH